MSLIVEDGTGKESADAYVSVEYVDEYAISRGLAFSGTPEEKEVAIRVATTYLDTRWGDSLRGRPLRSAQALEFPRLFLTDRYGRPVEGLPIMVKEACAEYAIIHRASGSLYPKPPTDSPQQIKRKKTVVGPITTEKEFIGIVSQGSFLQHPSADYKLRGFTRSTVGVIR